MTRNQFWLCFAAGFAWRLLFASAFAASGYVGGGGDALVYHVLGLHARDVVFGVPGPPLTDLIVDWWNEAEDLGAKYSGVLAELQDSGFGLFKSDTLPIILLHGAVYFFVPHPLAFTALVSILSAFANAKLIQVSGMTGVARTLILFNPLSTYFAATHLKEGIAEVLLIGLAITRWTGASRVLPIVFAVMIVVFRPSFWPICLIIFAAPWFSRIDSRLVVVAAIIAALLIPGMRWDFPQSEGGFVFSVVHLNEFTKIWLGLLVGFGAPYPLPIGEWVPFTFAMWFGGVLYWCLLPSTLLALVTRPASSPFVWVPILLSALIGYMVVGDLAAKTRFFSSLMPLLVVGWFLARREKYSPQSS